MKPSAILRCPSCAAKLQGGENRRSPLWLCSICFGCALRISLLRDSAPARIVDALWKAAKEQAGPSQKHCLPCQQPMALVSLPLPSGQTLFLDICTACKLVWFDANEVNDLLVHGPLADGKRKDFMPLLRRELQRHRLEGSESLPASFAGQAVVDLVAEALIVVFSNLS